MDEAQRNGKRNGRGGKDGRTAHTETGNGTERVHMRVGDGQRNGRDGNAKRATHDETGNETCGSELLDDALTTRPGNG